MTEKEAQTDPSRAKLVAIIERSECRANNPETPKFLGRVAAFNARIHRSILGISDRVESGLARWDEKLGAMEQRADKKIIAQRAKIQRTKDAEHGIISPSNPVADFDTAKHIGEISLGTLLNVQDESPSQTDITEPETSDQD